MAKLNLTFITIGVVMFVGVMLLIYSSDWGIYNNFMADNQKVVPDQYANYYKNLTSGQAGLTNFSNQFQTQTLWTTIMNIPNSFINTVSIGMNAIKLFASIPDFIINIANTLQDATHLPTPFFWMFTTIIFIIFAALIIKAVRNQLDVP